MKYFNIVWSGPYFVHFYNHNPTSPRAKPVMSITWKQKEGRREGFVFFFFHIFNVKSGESVQRDEAHISKCFSFWVLVRLFFVLPSFLPQASPCPLYVRHLLWELYHKQALWSWEHHSIWCDAPHCDILKCWSLTDYINSKEFSSWNLPFLLESKGVCELGESWAVTA